MSIRVRTLAPALLLLLAACLIIVVIFKDLSLFRDFMITGIERHRFGAGG